MALWQGDSRRSERHFGKVIQEEVKQGEENVMHVVKESLK